MSNYPVGGPYRIGVTSLPGGAEIDVSHYLTHVLVALAGAAAENGEELLSELCEIDAAHRASTGSDSHPAHERDSLVENLLDSLGYDGGMSVYGPGLTRLAAALLTAAGKHIPLQRGEAA